jgi:hypothetical protein
MKPHAVQVTPRGKIDGACEGGNAWVDILRSMAPCELDVFIYMSKTKTPLTWQYSKLEWTHFLNVKITPYAKRGLKMLLAIFEG